MYDSKGKVANRSITQVAWELGAADKGIYAHHTLKEIHEQKESVLRGMVQDEEDLKRFCDILLKAKSIYITGSGTSYHSALLAKHIFEKIAKIPSIENRGCVSLQLRRERAAVTSEAVQQPYKAQAS